jgi:membrane peptidoglycan carboxypeptidase
VSFIDWGGFPVYPEKSHAGLAIQDRTGAEVYRARHPERVFPAFEDIPDLIVATLLFVENRELLDDRAPTHNPAVEWDRFAAAGVNAVASKLVPTGQRFGGSTLATQIEKYRHSPAGRTGSPKEKLRQVLSASARAYQHGSDTTEARRRIVLDYVNSTPLSARPGFGEVIGLGDGLHAWFATDLEEAARVLSQSPTDADAAMRQGEVYKQVLCLLLAQRRPSYYLVEGRRELIALAEAHLRLLAQERVITPGFRDVALDAPIVFRGTPPRPAPVSFVERKALNAIRADLLALLQVESFYELDRLDMRAQASLDAAAQTAVTETLRRLMEPEEARQAGLFGDRLLRGDPAGVAYSFTLYERGPDANRLRVQADNLERPLDLNSGGKFDLGSTAKLRTLTTYLEIVAELHGRYAGASKAELAQIAGDAADPLTRWAVDHLRGSSDRSLRPWSTRP